MDKTLDIMEDQNVLDGDYLADENLRITSQVKTNLQSAAKWARFLAIVGFINSGFMVLGGFFLFGSMGSMPIDPNFPEANIFGGLFQYFAFLYLIVGLIMFFPTYYLYLFGTNTLKSLEADAQFDLETGVKNLKSFFKFFGVFVAIFLGFYALMLVFGGLAALGA